jgi:hypothetical protein
MSETPANSNLEPAPERLKIGRNCYGLWYLSATPVHPFWDRFDGPTYIRGDVHDALMDAQARREVRLQRELVRLTRQLEELADREQPASLRHVEEPR